MHRARFGVAAGFGLVSFVIAASYADGAQTSTIYRCVEDDIVTYSDRPCGSVGSEYVPSVRISILEVTPPPPTKMARNKPKHAPARGESIAAAQAKHTAECAKLERSMREIRSKMRAGYDAQEGERLKDRQRTLSARQRELRC